MSNILEMAELHLMQVERDIRNLQQQKAKVEEDLEKRMKEILDQYSPILEGKDIKDVKSTVKNRQKQLRLKGNEQQNKKNKILQTL